MSVVMQMIQFYVFMVPLHLGPTSVFFDSIIPSIEHGFVNTHLCLRLHHKPLNGISTSLLLNLTHSYKSFA